MDKGNGIKVSFVFDTSMTVPPYHLILGFINQHTTWYECLIFYFPQIKEKYVTMNTNPILEYD